MMDILSQIEFNQKMLSEQAENGYPEDQLFNNLNNDNIS